MSDALGRYIQAGEGISVEFKRCGSQPGQDTFETICSFANRQGGSILLGVRDDGAVEGVPEASALNIERNISNVTSNPNLFNVSPLVEFERLRDSEGRLVIRVWVPMGPSLYTFKGTVYDRVADADVRVKSDAQITSMMARKQSYYSERTVYPWVTEDDLEMDLLDAVRDALRGNDADHPWLSLSAAAFVPVPPVMAGMAENEDDHGVSTGAGRSEAVGGSGRNRTRAEVERAVDDLIARYGSFPASAVSERVASVGERTVRRYLADMVKEGKLTSVPRGRSTTYHAGGSADAPV